MKINIDCTALMALLELPKEEQRKINRALMSYPDIPEKYQPESGAWLLLKQILDAKIESNQRVAERNRINGAKHVSKKQESTNELEYPTVEITEQQNIEPEIEESQPEIIPPNRFVSLTNDWDIVYALNDSKSDLSVFLETGGGYDSLTKKEREFADRGDVRALCTWHKEIVAATKAVRTKPFRPPTLEEWLHFCREKNLDLDKMRNAYAAYQVADWHDTNGKPIKNWKQKILVVWAGNPKNYNQKTANFAQKSSIDALYSGMALADKLLDERGL